MTLKRNFRVGQLVRRVTTPKESRWLPKGTVGRVVKINFDDVGVVPIGYENTPDPDWGRFVDWGRNGYFLEHQHWMPEPINNKEEQ